MYSNFFHPHYLLDFLFMAFLLFLWDVSGWGLLRILQVKPPAWLRPVYWWLGLGLAVFVFFISHFFLPFKSAVFIGASLVLALPWLPKYLSLPHRLPPSFKSSLLFILIWLPLLPLVFVKTSLPPYVWDEAVYHYVSPQVLSTQAVWHFRTLYSNLPRILETAFVGLFLLTRTYATARLLHFLIYFSFQMALFSFLKDRFRVPVAAVVILVLNYLLPHLVLESTLGYIDLGTTSFILIVWLMAVETALGKRVHPAIFSAFAGLAVGAKYNSLSAILVAGVLYLSVLVKTRSLGFRKIPGYLVLFLLLGGYWYVKNWLVTGNPVFPFFFACKQGVCRESQSFFAWADPLGLRNIFPVISRLFYDFPLFSYLIVALIALSIYIRSKFTSLIILSSGLFMAEYLVLSAFAGFTLRYFYHWQILLWMLLTLSLIGIIKHISGIIPSRLTRIGLVFTGLIMAALSLKLLLPAYFSYLPGGKNYYQTRFAFRLVPVTDWILWLLPKTGPAVIWCESQGQPLTLVVKDPDLLWSTGETKYTVFLNRCRHREDFIAGQPRYLISAQSCPDPSQPPPTRVKDDSRMGELRQENYQLVCRSRQIVSGLYLVP